MDLTGSATGLGLVLVASRLPEVLLVLTGGVAVDSTRSPGPPGEQMAVLPSTAAIAADSTRWAGR